MSTAWFRTEHEQDELARSTREAAQTVLVPVEIERYLHPTEDTVFHLEYAFYLLGDVRDKKVVDLGCGSGEKLIPLAVRGADVIGIDLSPDLVELASQRFENYLVAEDGCRDCRCPIVSKNKVQFKVGSAYATGLPDESVDVVFALALFHHLEDLERTRKEIQRILRPNGFLVLREPVRFSKKIVALRPLFRAPRGEISAYEHPMTRRELEVISEGFELVAERYFRLPFVALLDRKEARQASDWMLEKFPALKHWATVIVRKLEWRP